MQFTEKEIEEFKQIYFEEYGTTITTMEAIEMATNLITLLRIVLKIDV
ncbi:MAG: hypothetical protein N3A71_02120 [Candidatus Dojkabacteria bacterium]|nr:hypothetical protein [Candidatus Dojkabacteria bacterium]